MITLESGDFDAYLAFGRVTNGAWDSIATDDDSAGGTNAKLEVTIGDDGTYLIRANTLSSGETGRYTLKVVRGR